MKTARNWLHLSPFVLFCLGWLSVSVSLYWFVFQPRAAVSRIAIGVSLLAGLLLILLARYFFSRPPVEQWSIRTRLGVVFSALLCTVLLYFGYPHPSMALFALRERIEVEFVPLESTPHSIEVVWLNNGISDVSYKDIEWQGNVEITPEGVRWREQDGKTVGFRWQGRGWESFTILVEGRGNWLMRVNNQRQVWEYPLEGKPQFSRTFQVPIGSETQQAVILALLWLNAAFSIGFVVVNILSSSGAIFAFKTPDWVFTRLLPLLIGIVVLAGWGLTFSIAANNRLYADDYCYLNVLRDYGWWEGIKFTYQTVTGRFMTHLVNFTLLELGRASIPLGPYILLASLVASGYFLMKIIFPKAKPLVLIFVMSMLTFHSFIISSDKFQAVFWTLHISSIISGLLLLFLCVYLWFLFANVHRPRFAFLLLFLVGFMSAGFHELVAILGGYVFVVLSWLEKRFQQKHAVWKPTPAIVGLSGILSGFGFMIFGPGNLNRMQIIGISKNLFEVIFFAILTFLKNFYNLSGMDLNGQGFPILVLMLTFLVGIGCAFYVGTQKLALPIDLRSWEKVILILSPLLVTLIMFIPSAFLGGYFPERSLFIPQVVLVMGCFGLGVWTGVSLKGRGIFLNFGAALMTVILVFAVGWMSLRQLTAMNEQMRLHAAEWDSREQVIQQAIQVGETRVVVAPYQYNFGLDLQPNPNNWLNQCVWEYYGIPVYLDQGR